MTNDNSRRKHFPLNGRQSSGSSSPLSSNTSGNVQVPEGNIKKSTTEVWQDKGLFFFFFFRISSQ
jgi:hypothetical protein